MSKFKMWHLAVIAIAVFIIFASIVTAIVINNEEYQSSDRWDFSWGDGWNFDFGMGNTSSYSIDQTETLDIQGQQKIAVSAVAAKINIYTSDSNLLEAHLYGTYSSRRGEIELEAVNSGTTSKIGEKYSSHMSLSVSDLTLDIYIPADYNETITIDTVSSDIIFDCDGMYFSSVIINTVSSDVNIDTLHSDKLTFNTISGNINGYFADGTINVNNASGNVTLEGVSHVVSVNTVSGSTKLTVSELDDISVESVSGYVIINLENDSDFYVRFDSVSSDFNCDIPLTIVSQKGNNFEGYTGDAKAPVIEMDSVSGSLTITH